MRTDVVARYLLHIGFTPKSKTQLQCKGITYKATDLSDPISEGILVITKKDADLGAQVQKEYLAHNKSFVQQVIDNVNLYYKKKKIEEFEKEQAETSLKVSDSFNFSNRGLARDILTGEFFLFDKKTGETKPEDPTTFLDSFDKDIRGHQLLNCINALRVYEPYNMKTNYKDIYEGQETVHFNRHITPTWRRGKVFKDCPPFFFEFLNHLFPTREARDYVLLWFREMLTGRNQCALLLVSNMGTGKGILENLGRALVGNENYFVQGEGFFKSQFNSELLYKRLITFDETPLTLEYKEILKLYLNDRIPVERKGQDPRTETNYASFIISNNLETENRLYSDDRRFSVPEITDVPLNEVFSEDEIEAFVRGFEDPEYIGAIGNYILNLEGEFNPNRPYKGEKFYQLMVLSLSEWERFLVEEVTSMKSDKYLLSDLKYDFEEKTGMTRFPGARRIESFLTQFKDREGRNIADIVKNNNDYKIYPRSWYKPELDKDYEL